MRNQTLILITLAILLIGAFFVIRQSFDQQKQVQTPPSLQTLAQASPTPQGFVLGVRTKISGCTAPGTLPDKECTPGAVFADVTKGQICTPGYSKNVRNVPTAEKDQVYGEYGITSHSPGEYEVDHLISLELGGSNEVANLWPEAAEPRPGFHEKDKFENFLHDQVCAGTISLSEAQQEISTDWLKYWQDTGKP